MNKSIWICILLILTAAAAAFTQTSWRGTSSTSWSTAANWTNGVPTSTTDAIIGDANFTGPNQPTVNTGSTCRSLTVGTGTKASVLTVSSSLTISGNLTIGTQGTVTQYTRTVSITGNWTNSGSYSAPGNRSSVTFSGASQSITGATTFKNITINAGSRTTLHSNITVTSRLTVNGTLDPGDSPTYAVAGNGGLTVGSTGTILVKAALFSTNYTPTGGVTLNAGSTVDYASALVDQTVSNALTYRNLRISGGLTKTLAGNLPALSTSLAVAAGTLDLLTYTANGAGGTLTLANGTTLKVGGANNFPTGYTTRSLGASSTVAYYGTNQTVSLQTYGNLLLSSGSGAATKTFPAGAMAINGNLTSTLGAGTSVAWTAGGALTVRGDVTIGASTIFTGGSYVHSFGGAWLNNGTFTGGTSTATFTGSNKTLSGSGANNFYNFTVTGPGVAVSSLTNITVSGNFATSGAGTFTHLTGGSATVFMTGAGKTLGGTGIAFDNLAVSGSVTASSSFTVAAGLTVSGSLNCTAGTVTMPGAGGTISGAGTLTFHALSATGSISTASSFAVQSDLAVPGAFTASAGTLTFSGTSIFSGTANLYNVTLNGTRLQLATGAVLGVAGTFSLTTGAFDVLTTTPNTVNYNAPGAQTVTPLSYDALTLSGGGVKTAGGGITMHGTFTIASGTSFNAGTYTHSAYGDWVNQGTFTAGSSTIQFPGSSDASLTGATDFSTMTVNKGSAATFLVLNSSITASSLTMTSGTMLTGSNSVTITSARTGSGIIIGTIIRTHGFSNGTPYAFEGPNNTITFASGASGVSSITLTVTQQPVNDFPYHSSINREYDVHVQTSGGYSATFRLHYEDADLNGNIESMLEGWYASDTGQWHQSGTSAYDTTSNWAEQGSLDTLDGRWTLSMMQNVARWNGSASTAWENPSNWTSVQGIPNLPPTFRDIAQLGTAAFTNQPSVTSSPTVRIIEFGDSESTSLTLGSGGSLTVRGNVHGTWRGGTATHSISVGAQALSIGGDLVLGDSTTGHSINLSLGSGSVSVQGSLIQSGDAAIVWTGPGTLALSGDYHYMSGTFTSGSGTTLYNGQGRQVVAGGFTYNNLTINKPSGTAVTSAPAAVGGILTISGAGTFELGSSLSVGGNVVTDSGTTLEGGSSTISLGGDWKVSGTFAPGTGTVVLTGGGPQSIAPTTFNNLTVNTSGGTVSPAGDLHINGDLTVTAGTLDLGAFLANRTSMGGTFALGSATSVRVAGANNYPANYSVYTTPATSSSEYYGVLTQTVAAVQYGNLTFTNGGSNAKVLAGPVTVTGDLLISSGSSFSADSATASIEGNWTNSGTFIPSTGSVILAGTSKDITGATTFNNLSVSGSYTAMSDIAATGAASVSGSYQGGSTSAIFSGDFLNTGTFSSGGTVTFTGDTPQTIALNSGFVSSGTVTFNGSVSPTFADSSVPALADVTIGNTAGITPDIGWTIAGSFTVASGAIFSDGGFLQTFNGTFTNNGTVNSSGTLRFSPAGAATVKLLGTAFTSTGLVDFSGTGEITVAGSPPVFSELRITNTNSNGITPQNNWTVGGSLFIQNGSLLNGGTAQQLSVDGDWLNNGTFDGGTSDVTLTSSIGASIGGNGNTIFHNLTIAGIDTAVSPFSVTGNFTDNGTFSAAGVNVSFTGGLPSVIGGSANPVPFDVLTIAKNSSTASLSANLAGLSSVTVTGGTFQLNAFTVSQAAPGGRLALGAGTALEIGGSGTVPALDSTSFDPASTVIYDGTGNQTVASAPVYGNIIFSNTGTRTASGSLSILGDLSLLNGTFVGGPYTHTLQGSWTMTGGTFTNTGTTIAFTGAGTQAISSTGSFNAVTVNRPSGFCTLGTDITVNGLLTFTSGTVFTGANKVILGPSGSVSRTSGHVAGTLQKHIGAGTGSYTFEIGDTAGYSPVSVTMHSVVTPGDIAARAQKGEYTDLSGTTFDPLKDVNRFWTISNSGTAFSTYDATFDFLPADVDTGADPSLFVVHKLDSADWSIPTAGSRTPTSTQATGMLSFSAFCVGEILYDTILATAGPHGSVSPLGSVIVTPGRDTTFTILPDSGYLVANVRIDGLSVGQPTIYTFTNVKKSHTIAATFGVNPAAQVTSITPSSAYRGQTLDLVLAGRNFVGTTITLNTPAGFTVNSLVVHSPDTLLANITVSQSAAVGQAPFTVTNDPPGGTSDPVAFRVLNHAPGAFPLAQPADGDTVYITAIKHPVTFTWHTALDPDVADTLTYIFSLPGTPLGNTLHVKGDTTVSVDIMDMLRGDTVYRWSVLVTDGYDTTASADTFSFHTVNLATSVKTGGKHAPTAFALRQNFPNPFNPTTTIIYEVPVRVDVVIQLYNILGQEVATLAEGQREPGVYSVVWDGSRQSSGMYFYTISAGSFHQTKRLVLVK